MQYCRFVTAILPLRRSVIFLEITGKLFLAWHQLVPFSHWNGSSPQDFLIYDMTSPPCQVGTDDTLQDRCNSGVTNNRSARWSGGRFQLQLAKTLK